MVIGFTVSHPLHVFLPREDSFNYAYSPTEKLAIICAADGITRDPIIPFKENLPDLDTFLGKALFALFYPKPSPAQKAADIFTGRSMDYLRDMIERFRFQKPLDPNGIRDAFELANINIREFNDKHFPEPDYLKDDFAGCVGSVAAFEGNKACYGFIADSGFAVFDRKGEIKFRTPNQGPKKEITKNLEAWGTSFREARGRRRVREFFRNNPKNPFAYGALTGEPAAMSYVSTGEIELEKGDIAMVFTDGLEEVIQMGRFADNLMHRDYLGLRKVCKNNVKTEGTLLLYENV